MKGMMRVLIVLVSVSATLAFNLPSLARNSARLRSLEVRVQSRDESLAPMSNQEFGRKQFLDNVRPFAALIATVGSAFLFSQAANAEEAAVATPPAPAPVVLGPPPADFGLKYKDFYADCQQVVNHMRYAVQIEKGNPVIADVAQKVKDEMSDFVAYYRRFQGIAGKQSFSLLYTSINVLAGHYTSYGVKFPVPEKRRKRLLQEFNDIEKNIRKKR